MKKYKFDRNGVDFEVVDCGRNGWQLKINGKKVLVAFDQLAEGVLLAFIGLIRRKK